MHQPTVSTLDIRRAPTSPSGAAGPSPGQWPLPLEGNLALAPAPAAPAGRVLHVVPEAGSQQAPSAVTHAGASRFVQALLEIAAGDRPANQLTRWMAPRLYEEFLDRMRRVGRARTAHGPAATPRARVASVHVSAPATDTVEIAARIVQGRRSRALALRLEVRDDRRRAQWVCTALDWG